MGLELLHLDELLTEHRLHYFFKRAYVVANSSTAKKPFIFVLELRSGESETAANRWDTIKETMKYHFFDATWTKL